MGLVTELLRDELQRELTGNTEKLIMGAYNNRYDFWAGAIWYGIMDCGLKPQRLIQAIIFMSDVDAPYVQQAFMRRFGKDLY